jgi:hypothetical protein
MSSTDSPAAGLEHLAIGPEHVAEGDVLAAHPLGQPSGHARHGVDHLEVLGLGSAHHVEQLVGVQVGHAVAQGREIGRGVAEALVALLHDQRQRLVVAVRETGREDAEGPAALDQQAQPVEVVDDVVEHVVVERFAHDVLGL